MEDLQRINVKLYLQDPSSLSAEAAFRIFNAWISESSEEVLVDVADYSHVGHGPITLLIGHEANYSLDSDEGELACSTRESSRKREICRIDLSGP